jgi:hypothetical protein
VGQKCSRIRWPTLNLTAATLCRAFAAQQERAARRFEIERAPLTNEMIDAVDWFHSAEAGDFRNAVVPNENVPGQLIAALNGAAMPELDRDYPFTDMTGASAMSSVPHCTAPCSSKLRLCVILVQRAVDCQHVE